MTLQRGAKIVSTTAAYLSLAQNAARRPITSEVWTHSYEAKHASIFDAYYSAWGAPEKREHAVDQVRLLAPVIAQREARAASLVSVVSQQLLEVGLSEDPLHAVLMVGVGTSNGWVADVDARRTLFLALELLPDPPFDRVLVTHEAVHTVQAGVDWPATVAADLWREGSATAFSRHLCPDLGDSAYLWFDDEHADWVRSCEADPQIITTMARENIVNADEAIVRALFSLPDDSPIPHRAGYWLGDKLVSDLITSGASAPRLLGASYEEAVELACQWL